MDRVCNHCCEEVNQTSAVGLTQRANVSSKTSVIAVLTAGYQLGLFARNFPALIQTVACERGGLYQSIITCKEENLTHLRVETAEVDML